MLESVLFLIFLCAGGFFLLVSLIVILVGLINKSKKIIKAGTWSLILPVFFFGMIFLYYYVVIPKQNQNMMNKYSDSYFFKRDSMDVTLHLDNDGTFDCKCSKEFGFPNKGKWETGGIDGAINFYSEGGILINYAFPSIDAKGRNVLDIRGNPNDNLKLVGLDF